MRMVQPTQGAVLFLQPGKGINGAKRVRYQGDEAHEGIEAELHVIPGKDITCGYRRYKRVCDTQKGRNAANQ